MTFYLLRVLSGIVETVRLDAKQVERTKIHGRHVLIIDEEAIK